MSLSHAFWLTLAQMMQSGSFIDAALLTLIILPLHTADSATPSSCLLENFVRITKLAVGILVQ